MNELYAFIREQYRKKDALYKKNIAVPGFFEFLFKHAPMIRALNSRYDLLKVPFFSRKIQLRYSYKNILNDIFFKYIFPVKGHLVPIITTGWKWSHLSIKEYNLIVLFSDFANKFEVIEMAANINDHYFFAMEEAFIKIVRNADYPEMIIQALHKVLEKSKNYNEEVKGAVENIRAVFSDNLLFPHLYDLLLAYNISFYKKYYTYNELFNFSQYESVMSDFYDCPESVFDEIVYRIESIIKEIKQLEADRENLQWLKNMCEIKSSDQPMKIIQFYNGTGKSWEEDSDDFFTVFMNLTKEIVERIDFLIFKDFDVLDTNNVLLRIKLLNRLQFDVLYQKLYNDFYQAKAIYISTVSSKISVAEFINKTDVKSLFNEIQIMVYDKIESILKTLCDISLKINQEIETDALMIKYEDRNKYMIKLPAEVKGKSLYQAAFYYLELFLEICGFFKEKTIVAEINRYDKVTRQLEEARKELTRISDANHYIENKLKEMGKV